MDLLRKKLFGSSSEKRSMDVPGQLNLFNEAELEQNPTIAEPEALESLLPEKETKSGNPVQLTQNGSKGFQ